MNSSVRPNLADLFREVADELEKEGRPLTVPPDLDDEAVDRLFWERVTARLAREEQPQQGTSGAA
jgi:hypothetical protein